MGSPNPKAIRFFFDFYFSIILEKQGTPTLGQMA